MRVRQIWQYKGVLVHPAALNGSGIRWWALTREGIMRSDTKAGMRSLITDLVKEA